MDDQAQVVKEAMATTRPRKHMPPPPRQLVAGRSTYKRAAERPPAAVSKRNARERNRVQLVNSAFERLRRHLPQFVHRQKRVAKLKILKATIDYMYHLEELIEEDDARRSRRGKGQAPMVGDVAQHPNVFDAQARSFQVAALQTSSKLTKQPIAKPPGKDGRKQSRKTQLNGTVRVRQTRQKTESAVGIGHPVAGPTIVVENLAATDIHAALKVEPVLVQPTMYNNNVAATLYYEGQQPVFESCSLPVESHLESTPMFSPTNQAYSYVSAGGAAYGPSAFPHNWYSSSAAPYHHQDLTHIHPTEPYGAYSNYGGQEKAALAAELAHELYHQHLLHLQNFARFD